jgi:hypothetical protein
MPLQEVINQAYKVLKPSGKILISAYRRNAASIKNYAKRHFMDYSSDDIFRALGTAHFVSFTSKPIYLKPLDSENLKSNDLAFDLYEAIKPKDEGDLRLALDEAMATKGGIDFDSSKMQLNVSKEGRGVQMEVPARGWSAFGGDQAMVDRIKGQGFDGLEFTIRSIEPVQNLPAYLGISLN